MERKERRKGEESTENGGTEKGEDGKTGGVGIVPWLL